MTTAIIHNLRVSTPPSSRATGLLEWQIALTSPALPHMACAGSARLAVCRWQMVACRPCQLASLDRQLNLLWAARVHPECSRSARATESAAVISQRAAVPAQIRRPRPSQNPNHSKDLFRRSRLMHISGASHGYKLFCNSNNGAGRQVDHRTAGARGRYWNHYGTRGHQLTKSLGRTTKQNRIYMRNISLKFHWYNFFRLYTWHPRLRPLFSVVLNGFTVVSC